MKAFALLSGGKDSFLAATIAMEHGMDVEAALTVLPEEFSMMFHYPNANRAELVAGMLGIHWQATSEQDLENQCLRMKKDGFSSMISGAIASEYQKTRLEKLCTETGLISYTPLWHKAQKLALEEILLRNIGAMLVSVSADGFTRSDLGAVIDQNFVAELEERNRRYGINITGEGGEYESFVFSYGARKISIDSSHVTWEGSHGYLVIDAAHIV